MSAPRKSTNASLLSILASADDVVLGAIGKAIPPSDTVDHAVRFFGTWGGTDKLMMTTQYTAKLLIFYLNWRAERLYSAGLRAKPVSHSVEGLFKFAGTLSTARRVSGLWGFLGILKALSTLERSPPSSRVTLLLSRIQGLSMLAFYPLEWISFFSAPFAPVLAPRFISHATGGKAALWSIRAWGVFVLAQVALLERERRAIVVKEREEARGYVVEKDADVDAAREKRRKRKEQIVYGLVANVSRLPVILHWSTVNGIYPYEILTTILSLISGIAAFRGGWENTRLPGPTGR